MNETIIEQWKPVKDFALYDVSSLGRVRKKEYMTKDKKHIRKARIISPVLNKNGYYYVTLIDMSGKHYFKTIHRLVATAFLPNPNYYPDINHKDRDKKNNTVENLEWCTTQYNVTYGDAQEKRAARVSKPVAQIDATTGEVVCRYKSERYASKVTGIPQPYISMCARNTHRTAKGYKWKFLPTDAK